MVISQKDGDAVGKALIGGGAVILRGAYINPRFISAVKPIKNGWYSSEYVEQQGRAELKDEDCGIFLPAPSSNE